VSSVFVFSVLGLISH
jgi:orotidine-5'-phosphate decarboxylase